MVIIAIIIYLISGIANTNINQFFWSWIMFLLLYYIEFFFYLEGQQWKQIELQWTIGIFKSKMPTKISGVTKNYYITIHFWDKTPRKILQRHQHPLSPKESPQQPATTHYHQQTVYNEQLSPKKLQLYP